MTTYDSAAVVPGTGFWPRMLARRSEWSKQARISFRRNPLGALGLFLVVSMVLVAVFAPQIATHDPIQLDRRDASGRSRLVRNTCSAPMLLGATSLAGWCTARASRCGWGSWC